MNSVISPSTAPHLILGVPSNCSSSDATTAFALKTRKIKSETDPLFSIQDLTAALSEIQQSSREESVSLRYVVPCNPDVYEQSSSFTIDGQIHTSNDPTESLIGLQGAEVEQLAVSRTLLSAAIQALFDWRWTDAGELARDCLRISQNEDIRDEALNVLAATHVIAGHADKALNALQKAVEGKWNLGLQANLALVATSLDPHLASSQMSYLIEGATAADEKLRAARLAIGLWRKSQPDNLDDDDLEPLPPKLLQSLYGLLQARDLNEEDFFDIGLFLAQIDKTNMSFDLLISASPHTNSPSASLIRARAIGYGEYIDALSASSITASAHHAPWIQEKVDDLVRDVSTALLDEESQEFAISIAFRVLKNGLDCANFSRVALRFLLTGLIHNVLEDKALPADEFYTWHRQAMEKMYHLNLPADQLDFLAGIRDESGTKLAFLTHIALIDVYSDVEANANQIIQRMTGLLNRMTADKAAVQAFSKEIASTCREATRYYDKVIPLAKNDDLLSEMKQVQGFFREVIQRMNQYH